MSAVSRAYMPGYLGTVTVDAVPVKVMGWKGKDSVQDADASTTGDEGYSRTERGLQTVEISFTMPVPLAGLPSFVVGNIYPAEFTINGTISYTGNWIILSRDPNMDLKGIVSLDVTCRNYGPTPFA